MTKKILISRINGTDSAVGPSESGVTMSINALPDVLQSIFEYIEDPQDRSSISLVCKQWYLLEGLTRFHVCIAFCYSIHPWMLTRRFPNLKSLKLKGKPRAYEYQLLPEKWGGYAGPWVKEITRAYSNMNSLHFRRMEIIDQDLQLIAGSFGNSLQVLRLENCSGFSSDGLLAITCSCSCLRVLYLDESALKDYGGEWLHELALHNSKLEVLSFTMTNLENVSMDDLRMIIRKCKSLKTFRVSAVVSESVRKDLSNSSVMDLEIMFNPENEEPIPLPKNLVSLSGDIQLPLQPSTMSNLRELDLMTSFLSVEHHHELLRACTNLEDLQARTVVSDAGLMLVANSCRKLRRIRIEENGDQALVTHNGLISLARSCINLQKLHIYVSDIVNDALSTVGQCCVNLLDFRLILTDNLEDVNGLPLDDGVASLLQGCKLLERLCMYLRYGGLTDGGLANMGKFGGNLKALLLGCVGESDIGFLLLAAGCQRLQRLEIRDCPFTEEGMAAGVAGMKSLKFIWAQGYKERDHRNLFSMSRSYWNIEYSTDVSVQFLAYRTLAGPRTDCPRDMITSLEPPVHQFVEG